MWVGAAAAVGSRAGRHTPASGRRDRRRRRRRRPIAPPVVPGGPDIRPALGDPAEVAKTLATEARTGVDVVRLVAGDPLSVDSVITEVNALTRTHLPFEIVPGLPATTRRADLRGPAAGVVAHRGRRPRRRRLGGAGRRAGPADPARHRVAPGRRGAHADRVRAGRHHAVCRHRAAAPRASSVRWRPRSAASTTRRRSVRTSPAGPLTGPLVVTIGKTVANRAKLNWWESRALYGWTVLVPRTKDQAGEMSERLVVARRIADRGADHRRRAAAQPGADGTGRQGSGRRPLPVGGVHLDQRGARGVGEVQRVRPRRPRVLRSEDRLRRAGHRRPGARIRYQPGAGAVR